MGEIMQAQYNQAQVSLTEELRKLWEQHVMWTRSFIISTVDNLGDQKVVTNRLLRNPSDFANVLKKYYGSSKANAFKELFEEHLLIAAALVSAAKAGNSAEADKQRKLWYQNAEKIADFLASINPYWNRNEWRNMMFEHLRITEAEAVTRLNKEYEKNVNIYDAIEKQALSMADMMAYGIIKQFSI